MRTYLGSRYSYPPGTDPAGPGIHTHEIYLDGPIGWTVLYRLAKGLFAAMPNERSYALFHELEGHLTRIDIPCT